MTKYDDAIALELAEGFDRGVAEDALQEYLCSKLLGGVEMFESRVAGVVAMERLGWGDEERIDWDELSAALEKATGIAVANIDDCDWSFDDRCDEEATYFAFAIPSLDAGYADQSGNDKQTAAAPVR